MFTECTQSIIIKISYLVYEIRKVCILMINKIYKKIEHT